jgi:capsular exopolysaccharide synthesis family protein
MPKNTSGKKAKNALEIQNAFKTLFANIKFMSPDAPIHSLVVTSSVPNEGKSTVSFNLASAIATSGKTVLLVEGDLRRRALASMTKEHARSGLYSLLVEDASQRDAIVQTKMPNLFFLDAEPNIPNPVDVISSHRFAKMIKTLSQEYDYLLIDTPPVGTFVDAAIISTLVDGTIMVVKSGSTKQEELKGAYAQLKKADANVLGLVATFTEGSESEYYYAYYTHSGKRVK